MVRSNLVDILLRVVFGKPILLYVKLYGIHMMIYDGPIEFEIQTDGFTYREKIIGMSFFNIVDEQSDLRFVPFMEHLGVIMY